MSLNPSDIYPMIYDFLQLNGKHRLAQKVRKKCNVKEQRRGINKKKLMKICNYYIKNHTKL